MATSLSMKSDAVELKSLSELRSALQDGIRKCGEVAFSVANSTLRKTILNLERQSSQYVSEINAQIEALGGKPNCISLPQRLALNFAGLKRSPTNNLEKQALKVCRKIESSVIHLYSKILRESLENENLKKLIQYQMNGIMRTTLQLKLLSEFLHNQ
ncbi:MAG TPA: hypothetical protein VNV85_14495 [Puia sp.]|jgi:hypothetical protein|nr:hypothetical protein [Puia sp.]